MIDKLQIWFRPTGWRPEDVKEKFPLKEVKNPYKQIKYTTQNSSRLIIWTWIQFLITGIMIFHLFMIAHTQEVVLNYLYTSFLILNIFSFTATLDNSSYAIVIELLKSSFIVGLLFYQDYSWFGLAEIYVGIIFFYLLLSFCMTYYLNIKTINYQSA